MMTNVEGGRVTSLLSLPVSAIPYEVGRLLTRDGKAVVETDDNAFYVDTYASEGHATVRFKPDLHHSRPATWNEKCGVMLSNENAWLEVEWRGHTIEVVRLSWSTGSASPSTRSWIVARTQKVAEDFFAAVCAYSSEIRDEVLVFEGGCWCKSEELFKAIQGATLDALVLPPAMKSGLVEDLTSFFGAREIYESHGVPWKRGILFSGPPGNGKTLAIKALVNHLKKPCLYVKSFEANWSSPHTCIKSVFQRARDTAPCVLVFEDLDALITGANKSYFLNELDGFAQNIGIVTLATTNHPEKLDPAIRDRPSRFDRTYPFTLPELPQRLHYMKHWNESMKPALRLDDGQLEGVATTTEGFSYAYIKELFFSSMMKWIGSGRGGAMKEIMLEQADILRAQMAAASTEEAGPVADEPVNKLDPMAYFMRKFSD
jgi:hypothetical protein